MGDCRGKGVAFRGSGCLALSVEAPYGDDYEMKKERFDLVFSLGSGCGCSRVLRERGLQFASFPLDWVGRLGDTGLALRRSADLVASGYFRWCEEENLIRAPQHDSVKYDSYFDRETGLYFTHDVSSGGNLHEEYPQIAAKYARRISRFDALATCARKILVVWIADPRDDGVVREDDARHALASFRRKYPQSAFRLLALSCMPGVTVGAAHVVCGEGYELYGFDYRLITDGVRTWDIRTDLINPLLDRFEAVDYRTWAEKRANRHREQEHAYEKFKANTFFELLVNRFQFKLYRHLKRALDKKGVLKGIE